MFRFDIITIFPDIFNSPLNQSIIGRAVKNKLIKVNIHNLRDFSKDKRKKVDDTPYGGGAGMVLTPQPLYDAIKKTKGRSQTKVIFFTPHGKKLIQAKAETLSKEKRLILVCGHYEGIDQRIRDLCIDEEISVGDYVLTGGELPALVLIDAITRLLPKAVHNDQSTTEESFSKTLGGKKEYPHYTKPEVFRGKRVPDVLLSGHHAEIKKWRLSKLKDAEK